MLGMEILLALGVGIGLSSVAGVRAFLPLVLVDLLIVSFAGFGNPPHAFLPLLSLGLASTAGLFALALLECILDKFAILERPLNSVLIPIRAAAGAAVFAVVLVAQDPFVYGQFEGTLSTTSSLSDSLSMLAPWLVLGGVIAGLVAVAKVMLRPPAEAASAGVSSTTLSGFEDAVALVGGALGAFYVPLVPLLLVAFLLYFFYRVQKRRGRKYGGLRILGD